MQVYRGMDIGTAKVTEDEKDGIPHYLIDILNPDETFSAFDFKHYAEQAIASVIQHGKIPIIVGGTGLYIQSLIYDYAFDDEAVSDDKMKQVQAQMEQLDQLSNEELHAYLATFDPQSADDIHPNNRKRVRRAIEYYLKTKKEL